MPLRAALAAVLFVLAASVPRAQALPPGPALDPEPDRVLAEPRASGGALERLSGWPYGPSYAVDVRADRRLVVAGQGRMLRVMLDGAAVHVELPGLIREVRLRGTQALVCTSHLNDPEARGLFVVDVSAPAAPVLRAERLTGRSCFGIAMNAARDRAAVTVSGALAMVDVAGPPTLLGEVALPVTGLGVALSAQNVAYVAQGSRGVSVVDVTAPAAPVVTRTVLGLGFVRRVALGRAGGADVLAVASGTYAPAAGRLTLLSAGPADALPAELWSLAVANPVEDAAWTLEAVPRIVAAASQSGVLLVGADGFVQDQVVPETQNLVAGSNRVAAAPRGTGFAPHVFVADYYTGGTGLEIDGSNLVWSATWSGQGFSFGGVLDPDDSRAVYVAAGAYGVVRLAEDAAGALVETGRAHGFEWNYTTSVAQHGAYLYVADGFSGLHIVDRSKLVREATLELPYVGRVSADAQTLVVVEGTDSRTVRVYGLSDPFAPDPRWSLDADDAVWRVLVRDGRVFVSRVSVPGVLVLDAATGAQLARLPVEATAALAAADGRLYTGGYVSGQVDVFDAAPPFALLGLFGAEQQVYHVSARGRALATSGFNETGVRLYDVSDPAAPVLEGQDGRAAAALYEAELSADRLFVMAGAAGVERHAVSLAVDAEGGPTADAAGLRVGPNPARGATRVQFALAEAGAVRLSVFDALGREVAVLAAGERAAGAHEARLDAARLAPGVYVVRLEAAGRAVTRRLAVVW